MPGGPAAARAPSGSSAPTSTATPPRPRAASGAPRGASWPRPAQQPALDQGLAAHEAQPGHELLIREEHGKHVVAVKRVQPAPLLLRALGERAGEHGQVVRPALHDEAVLHHAPIPLDALQGVEEEHHRHGGLQGDHHGVQLPSGLGDPQVVLVVEVPCGIPQKADVHGGHQHEARRAPERGAERCAPLRPDLQHDPEAVVQGLVVLARGPGEVHLVREVRRRRQALGGGQMGAPAERLEGAQGHEEVRGFLHAAGGRQLGWRHRRHAAPPDLAGLPGGEGHCPPGFLEPRREAALSQRHPPVPCEQPCEQAHEGKPTCVQPPQRPVVVVAPQGGALARRAGVPKARPRLPAEYASLHFVAPAAVCVPDAVALRDPRALRLQRRPVHGPLRRGASCPRLEDTAHGPVLEAHVEVL
eukprot:CAMPEP_0198582154 /NCGR_PEP_ID=MMETSP1462-20131121/125145_1 /TAXON_ID=1333877 /ORGANISM="Brandtodinium nutriculum, Strain RCC3387" /LENGTH=414 /DNA_ID=CAMNT_0044313551 /DNA_START=381 /DNA_END=1622 /DNA_ORIENTATION=-